MVSALGLVGPPNLYADAVLQSGPLRIGKNVFNLVIHAVKLPVGRVVPAVYVQAASAVAVPGAGAANPETDAQDILGIVGGNGYPAVGAHLRLNLLVGGNIVIVAVDLTRRQFGRQRLIIGSNHRVVEFAAYPLYKLHIARVAGIPENRAHAVFQDNAGNLSQIVPDALRLLIVFREDSVLAYDDRNPLCGKPFFQLVQIRPHLGQVFLCAPGCNRRSPVDVPGRHAEQRRAVVVNGKNQMACRVLWHLVAPVAGSGNIRIVPRNQQMACGVISPCGPDRIHEYLVHGIEDFVLTVQIQLLKGHLVHGFQNQMVAVVYEPSRNLRPELPIFLRHPFVVLSGIPNPGGIGGTSVVVNIQNHIHIQVQTPVHYLLNCIQVHRVYIIFPVHPLSPAHRQTDGLKSGSLNLVNEMLGNRFIAPSPLVLQRGFGLDKGTQAVKGISNVVPQPHIFYQLRGADVAHGSVPAVFRRSGFHGSRPQNQRQRHAARQKAGCSLSHCLF